MQHQLLASLGLVVLGSLALSCASADADSGAPDGGGGRPLDTGAAGASGGSSGTATAGTGGAASTGTSGSDGTTTAGAGGTATAGGGGAATAGAIGTATAGTASGGSGNGGGGGAGPITGDIWGGLKNPPVKSAGCGNAATLTNGKKTITSGGKERAYIVDIPAGYDQNKPYRLFYASHGLGGTAEDTVRYNFFGLKPYATSANEPAIFVAGQGLNVNGNNTWGEVDHAFFDDVTTAVKNALCVDTTRVFVTGMSMGGMYSYSLSADRQKSIRAGVGLAPTNFNIWLPNPKLKAPIAWMQTTGNVDTYCPWVSNEAEKRGSKFIAMEKATDNGCTIPATIPTWLSGNHVCYDFAGCKPGYPVRACTFQGPHTDNARDPGSNVNWIAKESWDFFMQF